MSVEAMGYGDATVETLERREALQWAEFVEDGPYGLVWVRRPVFSVLPGRHKHGWTASFKSNGASGWYPEGNIRNLKRVGA